jgi:hypothetical protein
MPTDCATGRDDAEFPHIPEYRKTTGCTPGT